MWYGGNAAFLNWRVGYAVSPQGLDYNIKEIFDSIRVVVRNVPPGAFDSPRLSFSAEFKSGSTPVDTLELFDDGLHGDSLENDAVYANTWKSPSAGTYSIDLKLTLSGMADTLKFEMYNAGSVITRSNQTFTKIDTSLVCTIGGYSQSGSWGDFNNDGYPDLFIANGGRTAASNKNFLFLNNGNWNFESITEGDMVNFTSTYGSGGGSWGDYDDDGDLDIFVSFFSNQNNHLYRNDGNGTFTRITEGTVVNDGGDSAGPSWVDYDNDGDLDLFVINDINQKNFLYRNDGNGSFTKITEGAIVNDIAQNHLAASWADFDNDRDMDVFVANNVHDRLYVNNGNGTFSSLTTGDIVNDGKFSLFGSWGDYDNDGNLDLFVSTYFSTNDFLYNGSGDTTFQKITSGPIVENPTGVCNGVWSDLDNDGDLDLFVSSWLENNRYYRNDGNGNFTQVTSGDFVNEKGGGVSIADIDRDGFLDIFIARGAVGAPYDNRIYANDGNNNSWLSIKCIGTASSRSAIGSRVRAKAAIDGIPVWQMREIAQQNHFNGASILDVHFGFGNATVIDSLVIQWPSGLQELYQGLALNDFYTATEGGGIVSQIEPQSTDSKLPGTYRLMQNYPNPFNPVTNIEFQIPNSEFVTLKIFNLLGEEVATLVNETKPAGRYTVTWDATGFASGLYFYRIELNQGYQHTKKLMLLK
jgi:hypothetical protein